MSEKQLIQLCLLYTICVKFIFNMHIYYLMLFINYLSKISLTRKKKLKKDFFDMAKLYTKILTAVYLLPLILYKFRGR